MLEHSCKLMLKTLNSVHNHSRWKSFTTVTMILHQQTTDIQNLPNAKTVSQNITICNLQLALTEKTYNATKLKSSDENMNYCSAMFNTVTKVYYKTCFPHVGITQNNLEKYS